MYLLETDKNRIHALSQQTFAELGFKEREHLQEWIAHNPEALGEELLIIQKEFDGFADTRERLDLLGLDKLGNLVVIENKLDDSGRDVVWQALKYASYCSSLKKKQIITIYQEYLNKTGSDADANELLAEFYDVEDLSEIKLNQDNGQRIVLVAARFRKEVTSTAHWLFSYGIRIQCITVQPFRHGDKILLDIKQILPVPEVKDLMIGISEKRAEELQDAQESNSRFAVRHSFWSTVLDAFKTSECRLFDNINPAKSNWIGAGSGTSGLHWILVFNQKEARVELYIERRSQMENKQIFDLFFDKKDEIESEFMGALIWERRDDRKASKIYTRFPIAAYDQNNWPAITDWMVANMTKLHFSLNKHILTLLPTII